MEAEILRRRAAGEPIVSIAHDFEIAHQTVSKLDKCDRMRHAGELEQQAQAAAQAERQGEAQTATAAAQTVRDPLLPAGFSSWKERLDYYEYHQFDSYIDKLNYNDALRGRETPAERRARTSGRPLALR